VTSLVFLLGSDIGESLQQPGHYSVRSSQQSTGGMWCVFW